MHRTKHRLVKAGGKKATLKERWTALLEEFRRSVPADITDEEIERDVQEAIEEARQERGNQSASGH